MRNHVEVDDGCPLEPSKKEAYRDERRNVDGGKNKDGLVRTRKLPREDRRLLSPEFRIEEGVRGLRDMFFLRQKPVHEDYYRRGTQQALPSTQQALVAGNPKPQRIG